MFRARFQFHFLVGFTRKSPEPSPWGDLDSKAKVKLEMKAKEQIIEAQSLALRSLTIEDEIANLRAQLPPIDYEAASIDAFEELSTLNFDGEQVECTCTFREVITYEGDDEETPKPDVEPIVRNGVCNDKADDSEEDETDDFCAVEDEDDDVVLVKSSPLPPRGAVKSIFDPEYDANENLIDEMVTRRKPRDASSKVIEVKIDKGAVKPMRIEPLLLPTEPIPPVERVPTINYVCEEDPMCPARAHFRREPVTNDDVERLHKNFINGVNGFWNGIPEEKPTQDYSKDMESIDYAKHQLWKRVVPRYDFLTCDKIPKTFDDASSFSLPPPPEVDDDVKPFNGARKTSDIEFREWHEVMNVRSYNDDVLTILPYVIID